MRLQGQGCSKFMVSEFAGARPSATRQKRHADPGEPSSSPCSAAARPVYGDVVTAAYPDTLPPNSPSHATANAQYCWHRKHACQSSRDPGRILRAYPRSFRRAAGYARSSRRTAFESRGRAYARVGEGHRTAARDPSNWRSPRPEVTPPSAPPASAAPAPSKCPSGRITRYSSITRLWKSCGQSARWSR